MKQLKMMLVAFLAFSAGAVAQNITYNNITVSNEEGVVSLHTEVDLSQLECKSQQMLLVTPVLVAPNGMQEKAFKPLAVCGAKRAKALKRQIALRNARESVKDAQIVRREKGKGQAVTMYDRIPYEPWMVNANLVVREEMTGCAECPVGMNERDLVKRPLFDPSKCNYLLSPVCELGGERTRDAVAKAYINFIVDRSEINPDYMNNKAELAKIDELISKIKKDRSLSIQSMEIVGNASPEARVEYNQKLSERRAKSLATYLKGKYGDAIPGNISTKGNGEDWATVREEVQNSDLKNRNQIIAVIDGDYPNEDARDQALAQQANYAKVLKNIFPMSRRNDVQIRFTAKPYSVEEAREVYKENPQLLSEPEIYRLAMAYPENSMERTNILRRAVEVYPNSAAARVNLAVEAINKGMSNDAVSLLLPVAGQKGVNGVLGVAYARLGMYDKAADCFNKAAQEGDANANKNLDMLMGR